jgi:2,4-dienoyl-CoA reductase-like NADH-dependent reductase (Old Yellow Enzyme family)
MYSSDNTGPCAGTPTDFHFAHLAARAIGGAGLVMAESTAVSPTGRISLYDTGLWNSGQVDGFARINKFIRSQGSVPAVQLGHAGRKASTSAQWDDATYVAPADGGWQTQGPSEIAYRDHPAPRSMTKRDIDDVVAAFEAAARRAHEAGFEVIELHGAHGYLIHQFLSPATNMRTDEYGGSFENRTRLAREVTEAVRAVWPENLPLLFRLSATDWLTENPDDDRVGWTVEESIELAAALKERGVDMIDVSSGGLVPDARITTGPAYQVPFADALRSAAKIPVSAVGLITEPQQADDIIRHEQADAVFLGRELLRNPNWPLQAAAALGAHPEWPIQYGWAV